MLETLTYVTHKWQIIVLFDKWISTIKPITNKNFFISLGIKISQRVLHKYQYQIFPTDGIRYAVTANSETN